MYYKGWGTLRLGIPFIPFLIYLTERLFAHYVCGIRLGFSGMTDYDFVPQILFASFFLLWLLKDQQGVFPALSLKKAFAFLASFLLFGLFTFLFKSSISYHSMPSVIMWGALAIIPIITGTMWVVNFSYFASEGRKYIAPFVLACFSGLIFKKVFYFLWDPMAHFTSTFLFSLLNLLESSSTMEIRPPPSPLFGELYHTITVPHFSIAIGKGCSGLEGISIFLGLLCLAFVAKKNSRTLFQWSLVALNGIALMFFLNVFRLGSFTLFSSFLLGTYGVEELTLSVTLLLHSVLGWLLNAAGLMVFFEVLFIKNTAREKSPSLYFDETVIN